MVHVDNYALAVLLCVLTMICWGSWANTQKLVARAWRFELYYWDFVTGLLLLSAISAATLGSFGPLGRPFMEDLRNASAGSIFYALLGGAVWNLGNLLLVAAIAVAGMAVGFPIGGGIAWVLGILFNYVLMLLGKGAPQKKPLVLFAGVAVIVAAILLSMAAYRRLAGAVKKTSAQGILLSIGAGLLIAFFYGLVVKAIDPLFVSGGTGDLMPLTAAFFFALGAFLTTFLFNPFFMRRPVEGPPVRMAQYWRGDARTHLVGLAGGAIWGLGLTSSFLAVGAAGPAVSYALSNAAPVVAILWGVLVWKEFAQAPGGTNRLLAWMFSCYLAGLALITYSNA
ncbi:MAG: multidrug DMT transporter permease [Bryobacterales bacterium]|nr:multidrug DMT transporter permease [Bryobacteraceae bacterium]MDW8129023.1 multidrug DMT transporter permease [Bryobacterales bacterium]